MRAASRPARRSSRRSAGTGGGGGRTSASPDIVRRPTVLLAGNAKRRADALGVTRVLITFTHEKTSAVAFAVAVIDG